MLKCKQCLREKELSEFYKHPLWFMWVLWRCKDCIKLWRKTESEKIMSRSRDRDRYINNPKRRAYIFRSATERRRRKWYANIHCKADRAIEKYGRPDTCSICLWKIDWDRILRILFHHPDYTKPYKWVFCCDICHSKIHLWLVNPQQKIIDVSIP